MEFNSQQYIPKVPGEKIMTYGLTITMILHKQYSTTCTTPLKLQIHPLQIQKLFSA